ncbi:magnesium transporter [Parasphingopyxis marina]|uniref:Magnesium transporter MgtE n=1 Tax=Parasphingopyxis marina TaxID=2761622 RepID=A0A842HWI5_9SPHN|nr:magnesium transporter [Parasphingopyxis marina]MBC2776823.1 magnesium transporter [Parasphingopyxis marina]
MSQDADTSPAEAPELEESNLDEAHRLRHEFVESVLERLDAADDEGVRELVEQLHPADIADLFEQVDRERRGPLAAAVRDLLDGEVLSEMNDFVREGLVDELDNVQVADLASNLDTDDAVAIIEDMEAEDQREVLRALDPDDRAAIEEALAYPEETAGRVMQRELVSVYENMMVGDVIDFLRDSQDMTMEFWEIFVVDARHHPVGTCALSWILRTPRNFAIADVMKREQMLIPVDMDQEEVALRFQKYGLISAAVVDSDGRLVGMITVDDIVDIIAEEAGEDILRLSGAGEGDINEPVKDAYRSRVRWLVANLGTALVASFIISLFGAAIEEMVALAVLMPIVASIGGNAGTQTMAVAVRALAINELTRSNTWRTIRHELAVAIFNGATIAVLIGIGAALVFGNPMLGGVIAAAMLINIVIAGLAGVFVPVTLERMGQDPAVASSVFVTMITDSIGFLAFLGLAVASGLVG